MARLERTYRSELAAADRLHEEILKLLESERVPSAEANRFLLAVSEAFTNALVHGNRADAEKQICVSVLVNETSLDADISDEGTGGLERISGRTAPDQLSENGRGIDLIQYYADSVTFEETADGGLKVSMHFERAGTRETKQT